MFYQIVPDQDEETFKVYVVFPDLGGPDDYLGHFSSMHTAFDAIRVYHSRLDR